MASTKMNINKSKRKMPENAALEVNEQKEFTKKLKNYPKKVVSTLFFVHE